MSLTFNLELDYKANKKGEKLLMIRCSQGRTHKRINTGIHLLPKYWNATKKQVKKTHPLAKDVIKTLNKKMQELEEAYLELLRGDEQVSLIELCSFILKPKSVNFYHFATTHKLSQFKAKRKMGTYRRYEAVLNKLKEYAGKELSVKQIDYTLIKKFETYLLDVKSNGRDTVSSNLSVIRSILNEAVKHGLYDKRNPFDSLSLTYTSNTKSKLTIGELKAFATVSLPNISSLHLARDFFMACFYSAGCRGGDMVTMKWENIDFKGNSFAYSQQKTGKQLVLPILPELAAILDKYKDNSIYIFPLLKADEPVNEAVINSRLTYLNKYIKEVCKYAGIFKKISSHCARHSFSDISLSLNDNDIFGLKDVLGHSSVKTTEGYLRERNYIKAGEYLKSIQEVLGKENGAAI